MSIAQSPRLLDRIKQRILAAHPFAKIDVCESTDFDSLCITATWQESHVDEVRPYTYLHVHSVPKTIVPPIEPKALKPLHQSLHSKLQSAANEWLKDIKELRGA